VRDELLTRRDIAELALNNNHSLTHSLKLLLM